MQPATNSTERCSGDRRNRIDGDRLALWYISANRDGICRSVTGIHRCVGGRVAEFQPIVLFEEMAKRRLRAVPLGEPARVPACFVNGYRSLQVRLERY